jgi:putative transposase
VAEAFFRTIKAEEVARRQYKAEEELRESVAEYIDFFNNRRPHQKFGYRTPGQVESDYYQT